MDWVLLRDGDGSGSDSDDGGCRARVPGGSDSASEDGSDSGFAIVRLRRSERPAGAGVSLADGGASDAPAMVASGVEEEDMENSGEEEDDDESSGEEDTEISEEEDEDVDGESSSEDCFEIPATRHTAASDANDNGEQPAFPGRKYDDIDDSDDDTVPSSSRICTTHNAEHATGIKVPAPLFFWIDEDHQLDDIDTDTDMEEEGSSEPVRREYDDIDDSCGMEESDCGEECDDNDDDIKDSEVEESGTEEEDCVEESDDAVATDADVEYGHDAENRRPEFFGRSYDDIDSGSDMEESGGRIQRSLSEFFFEMVARALPQVHLPEHPEFVCHSYKDIDSDCGEEDGAAGSEAEESCCEEEDDIDCPEEEEDSKDNDIDSGDAGESDSRVAYDANGSAVATSVVEEDQPATESRGGRKYDDMDTSESETDEGDSTASSDAEEEEEEEDAIHGVCGLRCHIVELGTRPVEVGSITELYCCFDPEAVVRPARVVCKDGKAICIVYDDGEQSAYNPRPEAKARGGGAEEHGEPVRSRYEYDDIDTDTEDGGAQFTAQAGRQKETALEDLKRRAMAEETPDVEDLLLEMLEESGATSPRSPPGSCARTAGAARWREQVLALLVRQAAAQQELERALARQAAALELALQGGGGGAAMPQVTRRVEAECDAPPPAAHVQEEHAGQRGAGSSSAGLTLCVMVYLLVYLATDGFLFF